MTKKILWALSLGLTIGLANGLFITAEAKGKKDLIVYYSWSGITKGIAEKLASKTGADLYEVELVDPYTNVYRETTNRAAVERETGNLPALKGTLPNLNKYDRVFIGGPVWRYTVAPPLMNYLKQTEIGIASGRR